MYHSVTCRSGKDYGRKREIQKPIYQMMRHPTEFSTGVTLVIIQQKKYYDGSLLVCHSLLQQICTNVLETPAASVFRIHFYIADGYDFTTQNTVTLIFIAVRTPNLIQ
jgi:hypothetical protein